MKRITFLLLLSAFSALALANSPINFGLNFRASMPYSSFESTDWNAFYDDIKNSDGSSAMATATEVTDVVDNSSLGYAGGAFLRLNRDKNFLHTEAMVAFQSTGVEYVVDDGLFNYTTKSRHLSVPVFVGRNLINSSTIKVRAFTGPVFSWLMNASATSTIDGDAMDNFDGDIDLNEMTWLWSVGAGVEVLMLSFDVRYGFSLNDIENVAQLENSFNQSTNMLEFTLGFKIF